MRVSRSAFGRNRKRAPKAQRVGQWREGLEVRDRMDDGEGGSG